MKKEQRNIFRSFDGTLHLLYSNHLREPHTHYIWIICGNWNLLLHYSSQKFSTSLLYCFMVVSLLLITPLWLEFSLIVLQLGGSTMTPVELAWSCHILGGWNGWTLLERVLLAYLVEPWFGLAHWGLAESLGQLKRHLQPDMLKQQTSIANKLCMRKMVEVEITIYINLT